MSIQTNTPAPFAPQVGDFVAETLVTDTVVYEVVAVTAKTIQVRTTRGTNNVLKSENRGGNPYPVQWTEVLSDPTGKVRRLGKRKDGTFRWAANSGKFRAATLIDGKPVNYTDYRV
jgi:hypothetical protein